MKLVPGRELRRGVLILPSLFTLGNLFCGCTALLEATRSRYDGAQHLQTAALLIALAMVLDGLDGKVARLAHATSPLGMQLDSLADVVSFGVAPALLVHSWSLSQLGRMGWAVAFVFVGCGALRLARFNVQSGAAGDGSYFVGLPIPGGAGALTIPVFTWPSLELTRVGALLAAAWTVAIALLMVSTVRYRSFKKIELRRRRSLRQLAPAVVAIACLYAWPQASISVAILVYAVSGPVGHLLGKFRGGSAQPEAGGDVEEAELADDPELAEEEN